MSAATRLRRLDEEVEIVVFERGEYVSFANCGLPYYVGGVIREREDLLLQTAEGLAARFRIDVRTSSVVTSIDCSSRTVSVLDETTGRRYSEPFDSLILAVGATSGASLPGEGVPVRTLRTVDDVDAIDALLDITPTGARAVVVGGGFIGLEAVENLFRRGVNVTLVQRGDRPLSPLDPEMAAPVIEALELHEVDLRLNTTVTRICAGRVELSDGDAVEADMVIDARGVRPDAALAMDAGLAIGPTGGIAVDAFQRTSDPFIYAVGDAAEKVDAVDGAASLVTMAGLANRHGRAAADAICGIGRPSRPALGTAVVGLFDLTIAMVGWSEHRLRAAGRPHRVVHTHPASHATYYPGAETMAMKLLIDPASDEILGAQIVGGAGVDKRIDVLATAMAAGLEASALAELELAYAPQYGSAKDPVNLAGYVAGNLVSGTTRSIQWHELEDARTAGALLVDVRSRGEHAAGSIPGAVNLPLDELRARAHELPEGRIIVHCQVGQRGHTAARLLSQLGRDVVNLDGGYATWIAGTRTVRAPQMSAA
jgi:NADPH-dependent 2,4-dienoyl-CoA reductase/sulfur reductase-like enzyme/rhodanese-related sulfurtransferase